MQQRQPYKGSPARRAHRVSVTGVTGESGMNTRLRVKLLSVRTSVSGPSPPDAVRTGGGSGADDAANSGTSGSASALRGVA